MCRLRDQERARGATFKDLELVVERVMQVFKEGVGRRVCSNPDRSFVNNFLLGKALNALAKERPPGAQTYEQLCFQPSMAKYDGE